MISFHNLSKHFQNNWVFQDISLEVTSGESVVLIGPSGTGKSVLLKIIAGLLKADQGTVKLGSTNIGMLFQKNALFDSFTIEENLLFPLRERKGLIGREAKKKSAHFLAEVGLTGTEDLYPDEISGGMQKRLGIARALIVEPEIILYDEPTAGLDPITSRTIADLIQKLKSECGTTVLTVTNDIKRAYQLADRICLLALGKLTPGASPVEIQNTTDPAIRQFIYGLRKGPLASGLV
ncbi:MAG: ATP-binding cassette domain-containing protein [Bdellovibrionia bacterium]